MCICVREGVMFSFNSLVLSVIFYSAVIPQVCPLCPNALLCIYCPHVPLFFVMSSLIVVVASVHQSSCQSVSQCPVIVLLVFSSPLTSNKAVILSLVPSFPISHDSMLIRYFFYFKRHTMYTAVVHS